ncbi:ent-kaur-16-ene synthase chloroplastic-like [Prunus yedoensis var. nudiflora]|uniref:Ent-kaur-16-ene synthase chloroplastic-like n=1 Tax=Prunus yedoensis var. nudiflora TaxID=2094558 RepID=A0A314Z6Y2_PRUYE|nr:ent-kaur-16-ene synthase chloroplastic-like [Prunus yedoensis var. nudiflora]
MSWAKSAFLTTVVDDFFDIGGSEEELSVFLVFNRRWDVNASVDCCSEHVQIRFSAVRSIISEIGVEAFKWQGRSVTNHVIETS